MSEHDGTGEHGLTVRLRGTERGLHDVARNLRALDRAYTFAASTYAYQRGYEETWANQTQYVPRPSGLTVVKQSPTIVQLWEAADVPALVIGSLTVMRYCIENVEKIVTIPERIRNSRLNARLEQLNLERELEMYESDEYETILPTRLAPASEEDAGYRANDDDSVEAYVVVDRDAEIERIRAALEDLVQRVQDEELRAEQADQLEYRARAVKRDLERAEPEIVESWGLNDWAPKRLRRRR